MKMSCLEVFHSWGGFPPRVTRVFPSWAFADKAQTLCRTWPGYQRQPAAPSQREQTGPAGKNKGVGLLFWLELRDQFSFHKSIKVGKDLSDHQVQLSTQHPPCLLNHVLKCHSYTVFEPLQGWGLHHCPGQPGPRPDHSFRTEIFPNIQPKPPLAQLEAFFPLPITWE